MLIAVIGMSGQYNHLILRRVLELGGNAKFFVSDVINDLSKLNGFDGVIIGGGPLSVPFYDKQLLNKFAIFLKTYRRPVLGICLGHQLISAAFGGEVGRAQYPEFGLTEINIIRNNELFKGLPSKFSVWESHNDEVIKVPENIEILASSQKCNIEAISVKNMHIYGVQFHPEVEHTEYGKNIIKNFLDIVSNY
ncbi:MAG: GMP synthase subunit A [Thermoprotei archaeon]|jgi:GMP synthase (glutamine-hydrolysing)